MASTDPNPPQATCGNCSGALDRVGTSDAFKSDVEQCRTCLTIWVTRDGGAKDPILSSDLKPVIERGGVTVQLAAGDDVVTPVVFIDTEPDLDGPHGAAIRVKVNDDIVHNTIRPDIYVVLRGDDDLDGPEADVFMDHDLAVEWAAICGGRLQVQYALDRSFIEDCRGDFETSDQVEESEVACTCTTQDDPNDHRKDCPMWGAEVQS